MATRPLPRIFTVAGRSVGSSVNGYQPFSYNAAFITSPANWQNTGVEIDTADEQWTAGSEAGPLTARPTMVSQLAASTVTRVGTALLGVGFQIVDRNAVLAAGKLAIVDNVGAPLLEWDVSAVRPIPNLGGVTRLLLWTVSNPVLVRDAAIASDVVYFGFGTNRQLVAVRDAVTKDVWGAVLERGADAGLLSLGADAGGDSIEATAETATFTIRYDAALAARVDTVTDDLGRVWSIYSTKGTRDRRYLELEGALVQAG